jgi:hypothetical protein
MTQGAMVTMLIVALDEELYERLLAAANAEGMTTNDMVMLAISNYLGVNDGQV